MNVEIMQEVSDCAVCLQKCHYPTQLPCGHIFCFLCVKGVAIQSKKCAMCRAEIPPDYLDHPVLLDTTTPEQLHRDANEEYQWYYEGRNGITDLEDIHYEASLPNICCLGWWKYDERSNIDLEAAFNAGDADCKLLLAGALYTVNFRNMVQVQCRDHTRRRHVKRDNPALPAKGIAGIKISDDEYREPVKTDSEDSSSNNQELSSHQEHEVTELVDDDDDSARSIETESVAIQEILGDIVDIGDILQRVSLQISNENAVADSRDISIPEDT